MRSVAAFAFLLLLLALAWDFHLWSRGVNAEHEQYVERFRPLTVRVFSCGGRLQPALAGHSPVWQGAFVDDTLLQGSTAENGLRVVTLPADGGEPVIENYDLGLSDTDVQRFGEMLADVPVDTVLAMGSFRFISPPPGKDDARRAAVAGLLRGLGARSDPTATWLSSFAFLCIRRPQGFVPIAEGFSATRGISLAFHLDADRRVYDERSAPTWFDNRKSLPLAPASATGEGVRAVAGQAFHGITYPAVQAQAKKDEPARMVWELGEGTTFDEPLVAPTFSAHVALQWSWHASVKGVRFSLLVNGREMGERYVFRTGEDSTWVTWEELLDPELERIERVEIVVERIGDEGPSINAYVGAPALQIGVIDSI